MSYITLVIGGARSGKSAFAEGLASQGPQPVLYVATAVPQDKEMVRRVERHRQRRPATWKTLELGQGDLSLILKNQKDAMAILLDCLSLYVSRYLWENFEKTSYEDMEIAMMEESEKLILEVRRAGLSLVVVTSEVGQGIVPENSMARRYRDLLGKVNQYWASQADAVYLVSAGIPLQLK